MSINIETASQVMFQVFPRPDYTIRKLQSMIENQVGIHPDLQRLFLKVTNTGSGYYYGVPGSVFLGNLSKTLENYSVKENDTIICVEAGEVTIQTIQQSTFSLWIEPSHTVEQLKYQMEQEFHIPRDTQRMIHRGRGMIDSNHLGYYAIGKDALIHLVFALLDHVHVDHQMEDLCKLHCQFMCQKDRHFFIIKSNKAFPIRAQLL